MRICAVLVIGASDGRDTVNESDGSGLCQRVASPPGRLSSEARVHYVILPPGGDDLCKEVGYWGDVPDGHRDAIRCTSRYFAGRLVGVLIRADF